MFVGNATHVDDSVAHTSEGGVDADVGRIGNLFETHVAIIAHDEHVALAFWQGFDYTLYIVVNLLCDDVVFDVVFAKVATIEEIGLGLIARNVVLRLFLAEKVDDEVMGDARNPR